MWSATETFRRGMGLTASIPNLNGSKSYKQRSKNVMEIHSRGIEATMEIKSEPRSQINAVGFGIKCLDKPVSVSQTARTVGTKSSLSGA